MAHWSLGMGFSAIVSLALFQMMASKVSVACSKETALNITSILTAGHGQQLHMQLTMYGLQILQINSKTSSTSLRFYMTHVLPVGLPIPLSMHFGNTSYLPVSFIEMLKVRECDKRPYIGASGPCALLSLYVVSCTGFVYEVVQACSPVVIMLGLYVADLEAPSIQKIVAVVIITVGTCIASYGVTNLSLLGICSMAASIVFEAVRLVMTQLLLVGLNCHPSKVPCLLLSLK